jgi:asparagine synthase (glutamine-hydrolysing)
MFAFILYDGLEMKTWLVRDPFGIKPLLYSVQGRTLIVASEVRSILSSGMIKSRANAAAIDEYLGYRYVREPYTFFEDVAQVPHGTALAFDSELRVSSDTYYSLPRLNFSEKYDDESLLRELDGKLTRVVRDWLTADVKVGSYLSGGLDSSLLTAIMAKNHEFVDTYTIGFDDDATNEFQYAGKVAGLYRTRHREFLVNMEEYLAEDEMLPFYKGAPLGIPNESLLSIMTANLAKDITVVISGEGADELFGGYGRIFRGAFDYENHGGASDFYSYFIRKYEYIPRSFRDKHLVDNGGFRDIFDKKIRSEFAGFPNEENIFRFFHGYHIQGLLQRLDACTMRSSVESRPPFLDHSLVNFVYDAIPYAMKLRWSDSKSESEARGQQASQYSEILDIPKYALKKVSEAYLPREIIYRKKQGFPVPLTANFKTLCGEQATMLEGAEWLKNYSSLEEDLLNLPNPGQALWMLLNVEKFRRCF